MYSDLSSCVDRGILELRMNRTLLLLSLGFLLSGCVTEQLRVNTDWMIGEKPRVNAIIVLDKKKGARDVDSS